MNESVYYGFEKYTQIEPGDINIMISVPHDGYLRPGNITDRRSDEIGNLKGDLNTRIFAKHIQEELIRLFLLRKSILVKPFMVINNLHRIKMDPNRKFTDSCFDCSEDSGVAYQEYHNMIKEHFGDQFMLNSPYEQGLLIDIHGHNHKENLIELGYLLSNYQLNRALKDKQAKTSSINKLVSISKQPFNNLVRGTHHSLGGIMQTYNLRSIPSPDFPSAPSSNYYSGGHITELYSSKEMSKYRINSIQIELPATMRHDPLIIENSARTVAFCLFEFYDVNNFEMIRAMPEEKQIKSTINNLKDETIALNYDEELPKIKNVHYVPELLK